jgi:thiol:disulfide interchange protein
MKHLIFTTLSLISLDIFAQEHHSKANLILNHDTLVPGMKIGLQLDIDSGWHAYWENPGDVGAPPKLHIGSSIDLQESDMIYPIPERIESSPYDSYGFENEALFYKTIQFNPTGKTSAQLTINAEWLICREICVPCSKTFKLDLPIGNSNPDDSHFKLFSYPIYSSTIQAKVESTPDATILTIESDLLQNHQDVDFFPAISMKEIFNKPVSKKISGNKAEFRYQATQSVSSEVMGLLKLDSKNAHWIGKTQTTFESLPSSPTSQNIFLVLFFAFLGGIILNLMPCVLPVVSLKVLSLLKTTHNEARAIQKSNLWFSGGICVSLVLFSFIFLFVQRAGEKLGWGFQLQSPTFVSLLIVLFFLIGLNLIGYFEISGIPLPGLGKVFQKQSRSSDFLAGFFTTLIATPCTAPFMAAAVGYAISKNNWTVVATFSALGLGLSFPYLLLATWPQIGKIFPRPGDWMIKLKEFLSFPMFLTVAWLIWLLAQLTTSQSVFMVLVALILVVLFFWVRKTIFNQNILAKNIGLLLIAGGIFILLLSVMNPPAKDAITWEPFDQQKIENYSIDSMVFVDFTADWCITCKANERLTFTNSKVRQLIRDQKIKMIRADWTRQNPEITKVLQKYERAGVPFYLLYKPGLTTPQVLPTLLTPSIFMDAIILGDKK